MHRPSHLPRAPRALLPVALLSVALALPAAASRAADAPAAAPMDEAAKMYYALGYRLGGDLKGTEPRPDALLRGLEDGRSGAAPRLSAEEMDASFDALGQQVNAERARSAAEAAKKDEASSAAYLAENAKKPGVKTTASGLQYRVIQEGTGPTPGAGDSVTVNYRGTLIDGTEFDSSYKRGQPATLQVSGVIPGWTEALQLMKQGAKWQLFVPPQLAYGASGPYANKLLIFDVELLDAKAAAPAAK